MKQTKYCFLFVCAIAVTSAAPRIALADRIQHPTAEFAALDKITGRITPFHVKINESYTFGTIRITPRACYTRPQTEAPETMSFVEIADLRSVEKKEPPTIFSGWMFAASPGLHGLEHPVYDIWLKDCVGGKEVIATPSINPPEAEPPATSDVTNRKPPGSPANRNADQKSKQNGRQPGDPNAAPDPNAPPQTPAAPRSPGRRAPAPPPQDEPDVTE